MQYRKKPVVIEAILYTGDNDDEVIKFTNGSAILRSTVPFSPEAPKRDRGYVLSIETKEGIMNCSPGDYMIKEPFPTGDRDFYPCKKTIFEQTYEIEPIAGSNGIQVEPDEDLDQVTVQGEINLGDPL